MELLILIWDKKTTIINLEQVSVCLFARGLVFFILTGVWPCNEAYFPSLCNDKHPSTLCRREG